MEIESCDKEKTEKKSTKMEKSLATKSDALKNT